MKDSPLRAGLKKLLMEAMSVHSAFGVNAYDVAQLMADTDPNPPPTKRSRVHVGYRVGLKGVVGGKRLYVVSEFEPMTFERGRAKKFSPLPSGLLRARAFVARLNTPISRMAGPFEVIKVYLVR